MTTGLKPGESRRAYATFAATPAGSPTPVGEPFRRIVAVEEVCAPQAAYAPPPLEWLTLFLTLQGHAELRVGPHALSHQPGSLIVVPSGTEITERVESGQPWHVRYLLLTGPWASQMDHWVRSREQGVFAWAAAPAARRQLLSEMIDLALTQGAGWQWAFLGRCAEFWGALYNEAGPVAPGDTLVSRLACLLDGAPAERPSVADFAAHLHLTPRQLIYQFNNATGEPLAQWVRRRRVAAARRLLSQGQSVTRVAEQLGFANPYHFSRTFKAVTGETPSAVRDDALRGTLHTPAEHAPGD